MEAGELDNWLVYWYNANANCVDGFMRHKQKTSPPSFSPLLCFPNQPIVEQVRKPVKRWMEAER